LNFDNSIARIYSLVDHWFGLPGETELEKTHKRVILVMQVLGIPVNVFFICFFYTHFEYYTIPFYCVTAYFGIIALMLIHLYLKKRFHQSVILALVFAIFILSVIIHIGKCGFYKSSGTILYGMVAPALVTVGVNRRKGILAMIGYLFIVFILLKIEPTLTQFGPPEVPPKIALILFSINISTTGIFILGSLILLINEAIDSLDRADSLLLNILPESVANRLKKSTDVIADRYDEATVVFIDIVGFTSLSSSLDATDVVKRLNKVFSFFDELTTIHGLEKIKTIGDSYMAAAGIPEPCDDHAERVIRFAVDVLKGMQTESFWEEQQNLSVRIGANTGPAVAGVIGTHKFIYDLWGDTVNIASRMESTGIPNKIQVTASTYSKVKHLYTFQKRKGVDIKGKGIIDTYLVIE
jgi:class 3 adenylate cyclase